MYGLDNASGVNVMPKLAPVSSATPLWFTEGGAGLAASYPGQDWFNMVQAELLGILTAGEVKPEKGKLNQLAEAIKKIVSSAGFQPSGDYATNTTLTNALKLKFDKVGGVISGDVTFAKNEIKSTNYTHKLPDKSGALMQIGDYGFGTAATELLNLNSEQIFDWLKTGAKVTQVTRNQVSTTHVFPSSPIAYFRTHDTWMALNADYTGTGVRVITGSGANAFTVHNLLTDKTTTTDKNGIVRSTGTKTTLITDDIAQNSGQSSILVMSQKATSDAVNAAKGVGVNQTWRKDTINFDVNYTNSSTQPITIIFSGYRPSSDSAGVTCEIDGLAILFCRSSNSGGSVLLSGTIIIPAGSTYKFTATANVTGDFYTLR